MRATGGPPSRLSALNRHASGGDAEREGFEPPVPFRYSGFQDHRHRPLGHLSIFESSGTPAPRLAGFTRLRSVPAALESSGALLGAPKRPGPSSWSRRRAPRLALDRSYDRCSNPRGRASSALHRRGAGSFPVQASQTAMASLPWPQTEALITATFESPIVEREHILQDSRTDPALRDGLAKSRTRVVYR